MKVAVIGAGSWGTALSQLLAIENDNVNLWARRPEVVKSINTEHVNPRYLSDVKLSENVVSTLAYEDCLNNAVAAVVVTPSKLMRGVARALNECAAPDLPVIICSKGVEEGSGYVGTQIFADEMGHPERLAVLSGPNHAEEVIKGIPAGTVIASTSADTAKFFQNLFANDNFRTYTSDDIVGVQLCGACKNAIAIAVGISYGMGFGDNTAAMLLTRGLAEMSRLVVSKGGRALTCMGLAGTGDLVATCMSHHSRNRRLGEMLAAGQTVDDFTEQTHMVAEGALACKTLLPLAAECGVEMPITEVIHSIIWEGKDVKEASSELLTRPLKDEFYGL